MLSRLLPTTGIRRGRCGITVPAAALTSIGTTCLGSSSWHQCLSSISGNGNGGESGSGNNQDSYYDSQSGMWIPIHDESQISVFWGDITRAYASGYVAGLVLTDSTSYDASSEGDDDDVLSSRILKRVSDLPSSARSGSKIFLPVPAAAEPSLGFTTQLDQLLAADDDRINLVFEYKGEDIADELQSTKRGLAHAQSLHPGRTSIGLFDAAIYKQQDPVMVANGVATLIDDTGGGSYVLLCPKRDDDLDLDDDYGDDIVALCEELSYLDVAGPTMKSRLVVSAVSDDQVEECLGIGVSKYVVADETALDRLRAVVEEQGKQLTGLK